MEGPLVYTIGETAELLKVSEQTVYRLFQDGSLTPFRVRGDLRVSAAELRRFIEAGGERGTPHV